MTDETRISETELDRFREQWRQEVAQNRGAAPQSNTTTADSQTSTQKQRTGTIAGPSQPRKAIDYSEELEPKSYHDLPDKEEHLKLVNAGQDHDRNLFKEPVSALEHYERAVEKETQGQLGESLKHYRQAFKLDDAVDQAYKKKHFPAKPKAVATTQSASGSTSKAEAIPQTLQSLLKDFSELRIEPPAPPTDASPAQRSLLGELPEEILTQLLTNLALTDVASFARTSQVCKHLAYLVMTEDKIWRQVSLESPFGFTPMLYRYTCDINGKSLQRPDMARYLIDKDEDEEYDETRAYADSLTQAYRASCNELTLSLLKTTYAGSWRQMFRTRPRIRFNGCYISTVNYTRPGASNTNTLSWGVPVHVVTYFRYLRFYRDGTVISLLTTSEPLDVVHHLTKDNLHDHHGNALPSAVMKDALRGRWRLTGPNSGLLDATTGESEVEGDVLIETEGVNSKYIYAMRLALSHAGKSTKNNKLAWKSFQSHQQLTDDWAEFTLKNDKAYYWSRVKSFT